MFPNTVEYIDICVDIVKWISKAIITACLPVVVARKVMQTGHVY